MDSHFETDMQDFLDPGHPGKNPEQCLPASSRFMVLMWPPGLVMAFCSVNQSGLGDIDDCIWSVLWLSTRLRTVVLTRHKACQVNKVRNIDALLIRLVMLTDTHTSSQAEQRYAGQVVESSPAWSIAVDARVIIGIVKGRTRFESCVQHCKS